MSTIQKAIEKRSNGSKPGSIRKKVSVEAKQPEQADEEDRIIEFIASTATKDRDGDIIRPSGIMTHHFEDNPVFLWAHNHMIPAIGRVENWGVQENESGDPEFRELVRFDKGEFEDRIYGKYKRGILSAVSIGFIPEDVTELEEDGGFDFRKVGLIETSGVNVPANPEAIDTDDEEDEKIYPVAKGYEPAVYEKQGARHNEADRERLKIFRERGIKIAVVADKMLGEQTEGESEGLAQQFGDPEAEEDDQRDAGSDISESMLQREAAIENIVEVVRQLNEDVADEVVGLLESKRKSADTMINLIGGGEDFESDVKQEFIGMLETDMRRNETIVRITGIADSLERPQVARGIDSKIKRQKAVPEYQDYPLSSRDRDWDSEDAVDKWRSFTDSENEPSEDYKFGFFHYDEENSENYGAYKLPYVEPIDGTAKAVWSAIVTVAATLEGARGGVEGLTESERKRVREQVERYYGKAREDFSDFDGEAPWNTEESFEAWLERNEKYLPDDFTSDRTGDKIGDDESGEILEIEW